MQKSASRKMRCFFYTNFNLGGKNMAIKKTDSTAEETIVSLTTDTDPPYTDLETDSDSNPSEGAIETATVSEQISQTESNDDSLSAAGIEDALNFEEKPIDHQTGNEANESNQNSNDSAEEILDNSENPEDVQIDSEKPKRSRRRRKLPEENQIQSDNETKAEPDESNDGVEKASKSKIRIPTPKSSAILSIDDELGVITDADKARNELLDLLES